MAKLKRASKKLDKKVKVKKEKQAATESTRAGNTPFPYSDRKRDEVLKTFSVKQTVEDDNGQKAEVTRVAKTGWLYVRKQGRGTPAKVDPTAWKPSSGSVPKVKFKVEKPASEKKAKAPAAKKSAKVTKLRTKVKVKAEPAGDEDAATEQAVERQAV